MPTTDTADTAETAAAAPLDFEDWLTAHHFDVHTPDSTTAPTRWLLCLDNTAISDHPSERHAKDAATTTAVRAGETRDQLDWRSDGHADQAMTCLALGGDDDYQQRTRDTGYTVTALVPTT